MPRETAEKLPWFLHGQRDEPSNRLAAFCDCDHLMGPIHLVKKGKALSIELLGRDRHFTAFFDYGHMTMEVFLTSGVNSANRGLYGPGLPPLPQISAATCPW
jgi:hypothetical protein